MDILLRAVADLLPQFMVVIVLVALVAVVLREYRRMRSEIDAEVDRAVRASIASELTDVNRLSTNAQRVNEELERVLASSRADMDERAEQIRALSEELQGMMERVRQDVERLSEHVPQAVDMKEMERATAAADRLERAAFANTWGEVAEAVHFARSNDDATSKDLERAGDVARRFKRYGLARELYQRAVALDGENASVEMEKLCLEIETDFERRDEALAAAKELVLRTMEPALLARVDDALIDVRRWEEMKALDEAILGQPELSPMMYRQAQRDLAVALQRLGDLEAAAAHYRWALDVAPDDEGLLRAYLTLLSESNRYEEAVGVAHRLVLLDPSQAVYYLSLAEAYEQLGDVEAAAEVFATGLQAVPEQAQNYTMLTLRYQRLQLRQHVRAALAAARNGEAAAEALAGPTE